MTELEKAWLAGLFEGEGCFYLNKIKKKSKTYEYPCAAIKMTDEDVVRKAAKVFGFGNIRTLKPKNPKWKQNWTWTVNGYDLTLKLFKAIEPYLGLRRSETAKQLLSLPQ